MDVEDYQLIIISEQCIQYVTLPHQILGRFWLKLGDERIVEIWGKEGNWYVLANEKFQIRMTNATSVLLQAPMQLQLVKDECHVILMYRRQECDHYQAYVLDESKTYTFGRDQSCSFCFKHPMISTIHASLSYHDHWVVKDEHSRNGLYVNKNRIQEDALRYGDCISLLHIRIFMGRGFLLVPEEVHTAEAKYQPVYDAIGQLQEQQSITAAYPIPVFPQIQLEIEQPTEQVKEELPMLLVIGPSMTMGISSLMVGMSSAILSYSQQKSLMNVMPTLVMSLSMALSVLVWPLVTKKVEKKREKIRRMDMQQHYLAYVDGIQTQIKDHKQKEEQVWIQRYETTSQAIDYVLHAVHKLHHRRERDDVFFCLTLGLGSVLSHCELHSQKQPFLHTDSESWKAYENVMQTDLYLHHMPIVLDLKKKQRIGIYGNDHCKGYLMDKLLQLILLHDPESYRLCLVVKEEDVRSYGIAYLPQLEIQKKRLLICKEEDAKLLDTLLKETAQTRYLVIFSFEASLEKRLSMDFILAQPKVFYLQIARYSAMLRYECDEVIELDAQDNQILFREELAASRMKQLIFRYLQMKLPEQKQVGFPARLTFLQLYGCGNVEQLQVIQRWNQEKQGLEVMIGMNDQHDIITLDAHESFQGPHGLVAGMTGSGKSEWLLTYLLSLAVCYSPEEVQFLLIDYKGGGMAQAFQSLPHTAGILTNLNQHSMQRCMIGIQKELKNRQELFANGKQTVGHVIMNIDQYRQLYQEGIIAVNMSHLFIVADEFAELKQQQVEFMSDLKQIARIGRSLGIHLILATQKPNGIVDEQIWSNARFHVCLKVQDAMDSLDMLKKEDAVHLHDPGLFYLQVGHDEWYGKGLCAWANAPYQAQQYVDNENEQRVRIVTLCNEVIYEEQCMKMTRTTQLEAVVSYVKHIGEELKVKAKPLWLKELDEQIPKSKAIRLYHTSQLIAVVDDIEKQTQSAFTLKQHQNIACIFEEEADEEMLYNSLLSAAGICSNIILLSAKAPTPQRIACVDDVVNIESVEKLESFFYQMPQLSNMLLIIDYYEGWKSIEFEDALLSLMQQKLHTIVLCFHSCMAINSRLQSELDAYLCFAIRDMDSYGYIFHGKKIPTLKVKGRGFLKQEQELQMFQLITVIASPKKKASWKIPLLPQKIDVQECVGELYIGKEICSKADVWIKTEEMQCLYILYAYECPKEFELALQKQSKAGITLYWMNMETYQQMILDKAQEQRCRNASKLWVGAGIEEYTYYLKLQQANLHCKQYQGILLKGETWQIVQLVEVTKNG